MISLRVRLLFLISIIISQNLFAGKIIFEYDFGDSKIFKQIVNKEFVSGSIPDGWHDESSWAKANCVYSFEIES
ncbi:MAG TPA: hypothetical protein P5239_07905, partial [Victivallales bacterium]|nr:hypothetical protein [Victivallales bacterium]